MKRRDLLSLGISASVILPMLPVGGRSQDPGQLPLGIIDTNISLFRWPFRRLPLDEVDVLVAKLRSLGVTQAWAGSFEGILHRDIAGVNQRLAAACQRFRELIPIGTINPELPDWEADFRRCVDVHKMPGIRLYPNYHGYALDDPRVARLLDLATAAGRLVQISAALEDPRTQHRLLQVPDVDFTPLPVLVAARPGARVQILNQNPRLPLLKSLAETTGIFFDTSRVDGTDGVPRLVNSLPPGRVMLGSHSPFLIPEAALIRVHESGILDEAGLHAILWNNAEQIFRRDHA